MQNIFYPTDDSLTGKVKPFVECWEGQLKEKREKEDYSHPPPTSTGGYKRLMQSIGDPDVTASCLVSCAMLKLCEKARVLLTCFRS